ncbi:hypothetical protein [Gemmatimonas groenlandica]|uniref:Uncharacterized protein n=1 Tax=Gemmatimonas groenlandica TaxID=2732249 RepID=A0A6M4IY89_9BACT|nr:hypothetical protein [Gemmatimonas groenlandica]QJR37221.1 hypothetical protein HKW67_17705 [Gemmatimonas groenlandica]
MHRWLKRLRGTLVMALLWAVGWSIAGLLLGISSILLPWLPWDPLFAVFDAPLPALAVPGFVGGALFSVLLGIGEHRRRFDELSVRRFAGWGAVGGLLLTMIPASAVLSGSATGADLAHEFWALTSILVVPLTTLSAASAAGSLWLARRAKGSRELEAGRVVDDLWLTDGQAKDLIALAE